MKSSSEDNRVSKGFEMTDSIARQHLNWAVERALAEYDVSGETAAFASFMSDVNKEEDIAWIAGNPMSVPILLMGLRLGRDEFKKAMEGFNV